MSEAVAALDEVAVQKAAGPDAEAEPVPVREPEREPEPATEEVATLEPATPSGGFVVLEGDPVVLGVNEGTDGQGRGLHRIGGLEFFVGAGIRLWISAPSRAAATKP